MTVTEDDAPPSTVREKAPAGIPEPVRGTVIGELGSELVIVRLPVRAPVAVGVKAMVTAQLAPGASVDAEQGLVAV